MNDIPDWALKYKTKGIQIRRFGNNLYAYHPRSVYDKINKKSKSLPPEYIGVVIRNGIIKRSEIAGIRGNYEYGNIALLYGIVERMFLPNLRKIFPYMHDRIIAYVVLRNIQLPSDEIPLFLV